MNAIELLTNQHRELEAAFKAVTGAEGAARQELFARVADVLMSHVLIEEQLFYPAVNAKRTEDILLESLEEHLSLKRILSDLVALPVDAQGFEPKFHVLAEQAEHHHEEEEKKLFPKVQKLLGSDELEALGERMSAAQAGLLTKQPRTLAPEQTDEAAVLGKSS
jgi:hemerythrin superfamily protein